jgi:L-amino acid N-acyltransferase YncA
MNLIIREARPEDAEAVTAIFNPIIEDGRYTVFDAPLPVAAERAYLEAFPPRGIFLLAVDSASDRIVGFQSMEPFASYTGAFDHVGILGTYVSLEQRRRGIARALFPSTFEQARGKGYERSSRSSEPTTQRRWQPIPLTASP